MYGYKVYVRIASSPAGPSVFLLHMCIYIYTHDWFTSLHAKELEEPGTMLGTRL